MTSSGAARASCPRSSKAPSKPQWRPQRESQPAPHCASIRALRPQPTIAQCGAGRAIAGDSPPGSTCARATPLKMRATAALPLSGSRFQPARKYLPAARPPCWATSRAVFALEAASLLASPCPSRFGAARHSKTSPVVVTLEVAARPSGSSQRPALPAGRCSSRRGANAGDDCAS
jgi:hypothetical protein